MTLFDLPAALLVISQLIGSATSDVQIASQSLASEAILQSVKDARKRGVQVKVVLGAQAAYELDSQGNPYGPNRPYEKGPQGPELVRLRSYGADIYIPPRFNEIQGEKFAPGVQAHMTYVVVDQKTSVLCSAPLSQSAVAGLCVQTNEPVVIKSLASLHALDFDYLMDSKARAQHAESIRPPIIVTPEAAINFRALLQKPLVKIATAQLSDGEVVTALIASKYRPIITTSRDSLTSRVAVGRLKEAGYDVRVSRTPFDGTFLVGDGFALVSSQRLTDLHLSSSRDVGILIGAQSAQRVAEFVAGVER